VGYNSHLPRCRSMYILAIDASTELCSAALWRDGEICQRTAAGDKLHSEQLLLMVDVVLAEGGVTLDRLDGIAYGQGPGAFTGLRVACAVVQGLAFPQNIPVAGISTLQAMALACAAPRVVCCLDARMGEIYHAAYVMEEGSYIEHSAPCVCAPDDAPPLADGGWTGCGSGFEVYGDKLKQCYGTALQGITGGIHPVAADIARLAAPLFAAGQGVAAERAAPVYIRDKVALKTAER